MGMQNTLWTSFQSIQGDTPFTHTLTASGSLEPPEKL